MGNWQMNQINSKKKKMITGWEEVNNTLFTRRRTVYTFSDFINSMFPVTSQFFLFNYF